MGPELTGITLLSDLAQSMGAPPDEIRSDVRKIGDMSLTHELTMEIRHNLFMIIKEASFRLTLEIDADGTALWIPCLTLGLKAGVAVNYVFPEGFSAYWIRAVSSADTTATVMFKYE